MFGDWTLLSLLSMGACVPAQVVGGLPEDTPDAPEIPSVKGHQLLGGPQMLQLRSAALGPLATLQQTFFFFQDKNRAKQKGQDIACCVMCM